MHEKIMIPSIQAELEAELTRLDPKKVGVASHPHPLYGGSMHNNVVEAIIQTFTQNGMSALRFNFRGVGKSSGAFGDGIEEQKDLMAVVKWLKSQGFEEIIATGYSFGAWVTAHAWPELEAEGLSPPTLVAPPAAFMSFDNLPPSTTVNAIICGEQDDFGPPPVAAELGRVLNPPIEPIVIKGADHFFIGRENELIQIIEGSIF